MSRPGPNDRGLDLVPWDEAREVVVVVLTLCAASMVLAPILFGLVDGQYDRAGFASSLSGLRPLTGFVVLGAATLTATTPAADVVPRLRSAVAGVATLIMVIGVLSIFEILFSDSAGGVRRFSLRFPTILTFKGPATLMAGCAAWLARRVIPFPDG